MAITNGQTADADDINAELSALANDISALASAAVKLTGNQTLQGVKTFGSIPVLPASDPTTDNQAVRKAYVDGKFALAAGDILLKSADTERGNGQYNTTYVKVKEFVIGRNYGTLRIKFDLASYNDSVSIGYGRIYRNGVAVGTEQSQSKTYATKSEDISGWVAGDLCQLYCKTNRNDRYWLVKNFRIYASVGETISVNID